MALSRTETLFTSRWPWSDHIRSIGHQQSNWPTHPIHDLCMSSCKRSIVTIALSRTEAVLYCKWPWSAQPFKVTKAQTDYAIRFATYKLQYKCHVTIALSLTNTAKHEFRRRRGWRTKIHKTQSSVPTSFCNTGSWPGFSRSLGHHSFEKQSKMDSLTSKTLWIKKLFI